MKQFYVILLLGFCFGSAEGQQLPAPTLSLSLNNEVTLETYRGWPLLARAELLNEFLLLNPSNTNVQTIGAVSKSWANAITIQIAGAAGSWPFELANAPAGALTLTSDFGGEVGWWISPEHSAQLAAGTYRLQAGLDTTAASEGWHGTVTSQIVTVKLSDEPAQLTPALTAEKFLRLAEYAISQSDLARANSLMDDLLALQSTNVTALTRKADLLVMSHQEAQALDFYEFALQAFFLQHPGSDVEPPVTLLKADKALFAKLAFQPNCAQLSLKVWLATDGHIHLEWPAVSGQSYTVESTRDFSSWQIEATGITADQTFKTWLTPLSASPRFFRVSNDHPPR